MEAWRKELYHHGIKGQKWGVRRYQNPNGTLTEAGKKRYSTSDGKSNNQLKKDWPSVNKDNQQSYETYPKLQKLIEDKAGDWYTGKWKTPALQKIANDRKQKLNEIRNNNQGLKAERKIRDEYDELMLGEVLKELGYENSQENRDYIRKVVIWD